MLDWANLIGAPADSKTGDIVAENAEDGTKCPIASHGKESVSHAGRDSLNPVTARLADDFSPSVPIVPLKKQGRGKEGWKEERGADGAAAEPQDLRADKSNDQQRTNPAHPAAVLLLMAWSRFKHIPHEERAEMLLDLETMEPSDQVRCWHKVSMQDGLRPWHVLCLPAPLSGSDCTMCRNLMTRHETIGNDRVQFHWACELGYLILEHGRGTERIWIAPPECKSFQRWYPSDWR